MNILEIDGDYLEGGGQILRTAAGLSCITGRSIRVKNIRARRSNPGLKAQHLHTLNALAKLFDADTEGLALDSQEIIFSPRRERALKQSLDIDIGTSGAIGLLLQPLLLAAAFKSEDLSLNIKGGTCGLGAVPVDYYPNCIFPILAKSGLKAELKIFRRGYYPQGGGEVSVDVQAIKYPKRIDLVQQGSLKRIFGISIASQDLIKKDVAQRQARAAREFLKSKFSCPIDIRAEYVETYSVSSEINLYAHMNERITLAADARGQIAKSAETVGRQAAKTLIEEIESGAACDVHLADNIIPWLCLLGGVVRASQISTHTQTSIWVAEQFFGKVFKLENNTISVENEAI